jgi:hypothetical protein
VARLWTDQPVDAGQIRSLEASIEQKKRELDALRQTADEEKKTLAALQKEHEDVTKEKVCPSPHFPVLLRSLTVLLAGGDRERKVHTADGLDSFPGFAN